jgi:hypothetical protein
LQVCQVSLVCGADQGVTFWCPLLAQGCCSNPDNPRRQSVQKRQRITGFNTQITNRVFQCRIPSRAKKEKRNQLLTRASHQFFFATFNLQNQPQKRGYSDPGFTFDIVFLRSPHPQARQRC